MDKDGQTSELGAAAMATAGAGAPNMGGGRAAGAAPNENAGAALRAAGLLPTSQEPRVPPLPGPEQLWPLWLPQPRWQTRHSPSSEWLNEQPGPHPPAATTAAAAAAATAACSTSSFDGRRKLQPAQSRHMPVRSRAATAAEAPRPPAGVTRGAQRTHNSSPTLTSSTGATAGRTAARLYLQTRTPQNRRDTHPRATHLRHET